jgi:hypothetical protein
MGYYQTPDLYPANQEYQVPWRWPRFVWKISFISFLLSFFVMNMTLFLHNMLFLFLM